jgi:hypothetical protein
MKKFYHKIKEYLNPSWDSKFSFSKLNLLTTFPDFKPHGNDRYEKFEPVLIENINNTIPTLSKVNSMFNNIEIKSLVNTNFESETLWNELFTKHNTDKFKRGYHKVYVDIFKNKKNFTLLEFGLGTPNQDKLSTGAAGKDSTPGAFLFALKEMFPDSSFYGADYDKSILFEDSSIQTYYVDVTDKNSILGLYKNLNIKFDFIIDDSLATQFSSLYIVETSFNYLEKGGYLIIENVGIWTLDTWKILIQIVKDYFQAEIYETNENNFVVLLKKL